MGGRIHDVGHTLSRISIRFTASAGVSGGEPLGDCSARNVVETMKGISCASTPSFARSSGAIGGKSGGGSPRQWVVPVAAGIGAH